MFFPDVDCPLHGLSTVSQAIGSGESDVGAPDTDEDDGTPL
jgi:hypothetical protein